MGQTTRGGERQTAAGEEGQTTRIVEGQTRNVCVEGGGAQIVVG